jgi:hypothetical protein
LRVAGWRSVVAHQDQPARLQRPVLSGALAT